MPARLASALVDHEVSTVAREGWSGTKNGALLTLAEQHGWDAILTVDGGMPFQNRMQGRVVSLILVKSPTNALDQHLHLMPEVNESALSLAPGSVVRIPA